ncbi:MAG TPA: hypothetical protein VLR46_08970 [Candidatus Dormibacteraeota bacterium]|nr:hypothetical protein [Candidatus Dormibacteraeota bacterium]
MAHLSEGTLRRMFDDPDALAGSDRRHFVDCAECQVRYAAMADDARAVTTLLAVPELKPDLASALKRVQVAPAAKPRFGFQLPILRPSSRPMFAGFAAAVVVAVLAITAFANILPLFQPKTVEAIPVTVADLQSLSALSDYGTVTWSQQPNLKIALNAADAEAIANGMKVPTPGYLPSGISSTVTYGAMSGAVAVFTFDANKAAAAAAKSGKALPKLPAGMDGSKLTVTAGPAVAAVYGNLNTGTGSNSSSTSQNINLPELVIARTAAPVVTTSGQVTTKQFEDYILSMPGVSKELAAAVHAIKDPSTTLLIPVPVQYATSKNVTVQGVNGVAVGDNTGLGSGVIWINGDIFAVAGPIKQDEALKIADGLKTS